MTASRSRLPEDLARFRALDEHAAAELLGVNRGTLSNWRGAGRGPRWFRAGRAIRYRVSDLVAWTEAHSVDPGCGR